MYEQGFWPSRFNHDHKWCFSISGLKLHERHVVLLDQRRLFHAAEVLKLELVERGYNHALSPHDQSLSIACEPAIEIVCRKNPA